MAFIILGVAIGALCAVFATSAYDATYQRFLAIWYMLDDVTVHAHPRVIAG